MATSVHSESRRKYSWWWDSHIPKNSKWLQENLTDMDTKVKSMIKLIEEDADSFARRAEMYYKKRPELMKLVEEFYRAYRALAERYDHATVELRHAHRTMAEAFPSQVPLVFGDDLPSTPSGSESDPQTPEMRHPIRAFFDPIDSDEANSGMNKKGLKQLNAMFRPQKGDEVKIKKGLNFGEAGDSEPCSQDSFSQLSSEILNLKTRFLSESIRAGQAESEAQSLKKILAEAQAEKEDVSNQYEQSLKKLSSLERDLSEAQEDAGSLGERASKAEIEIKILKEALAKLEAERDAAIFKYNQCLDKISALESALSQAKGDAEGLNERAYKAETEAENLRLELSKLEAEKEAGLLQYKQCLEMIAALENKISVAKENARMLIEKSEKAENEVIVLKEMLDKLKEEKNAIALQYDRCLETMAQMESEISCAREEVKQLKSDVVEGAVKLRSVEEQRALLKRSNESLQEEAGNLVQKIGLKDRELSEKQKELENLHNVLQNEQSRFLHVETTLQTLQKLHSDSQVEQRELTLELQNRLQMLKELELCNQALEDDSQRVKGENQSLNDEIHSLKEIKEKLEEELTLQMVRSNTLQEEVYKLKEEIEVLSKEYQALIEQLRSLGFNPASLESSVKELQNKNSKLKEDCFRHEGEKEVFHEKLRMLDTLLEQNADLRISHSALKGKLEGSRELVQELHQSCQFLQGDKSTLVAEKATLLSQLQIMTENMQKLLERNTMLETSLFGANVELEGLRAKSKNLKEFCDLLKNEKSNLLSERSILISQLENVEQRLSNLEKRFTRLEEKYADMEKEKESTLSQVDELRGSLSQEQQERECYVQSSESRLSFLENHLSILKEESRSRKKEHEEELDKAVNAQVEIIILQKFVKDLEEKNLSLLIECQKHVDGARFSEKLIRELESENLEQQIEAEFLLDEIEKLRLGIYQVFKALQCDSVSMQQDLTEADQIHFPLVLNIVKDLKSSLDRNKDENQQLLVENSLLLTFLCQLKLESSEVELEKNALKEEFIDVKEKSDVLWKEKHELLEMNQQLKLEVSDAKLREEVLTGQLETQHKQLQYLQENFLALQGENLKQLEENRILLEKFLDLKEEMCALEEENITAIDETVALDILSSVFESFCVEKAEQVKALTEDLNGLRLVSCDLKEKTKKMAENLEKKEAENQLLNETIKNLQEELHAAKDLNDQLNYETVMGKDFLKQKCLELLEAEKRINAAENVNAELCRSLEGLRREFEESKHIRNDLEEQILRLSKDGDEQKTRINCLLVVNESLGSEVGLMRSLLEEHRIREDDLNLELQERSNEFKLWEVEASSFYFDCQVSSICEVLLENKVHELTGLCSSLGDESAAKSAEIGHMNETVGFLEKEVGGLKAQLSAYAPVVASLKENVASIEQNVHFGTKKGGQRAEKVCDMRYEEPEEHEITVVATGISDLKEVQSRLEAVEKAVMEEMSKLAKFESDARKPVLNPRNASFHEQIIPHLNLEKMKPEVSEARNGTSMKDIPLDHSSDHSFYDMRKRANSRSSDQMLELWESTALDSSIDLTISDMQRQVTGSSTRVNSQRRHSRDVEKELGIDKVEVSSSSRQPRQGAKSRKVLERLSSDAQKLTSLQTSVRELKKRVDPNKRSKKAYGLEYEEVKGQLQEVEEAIMELVNINDQLVKDVEESPLPSEEAGNVSRKKMTDQAQRGSEKIGRLQFEVQTIEYVLLKLEDERKSKKGTKISRGKTGVILLRDFIYSGGKHVRRRKKGCFCGCSRASTSGE